LTIIGGPEISNSLVHVADRHLATIEEQSKRGEQEKPDYIVKPVIDDGLKDNQSPTIRAGMNAVVGAAVCLPLSFSLAAFGHFCDEKG
jgi:hypothetical protein